MGQPQLKNSYIVRVLTTKDGQRLSVQNLRNKETYEFESWLELGRFMHLKENQGNLQIKI